MTHAMYTIHSTTNTAPIIFDRVSPDKVQITLEDGSTQEYWVTDLQQALDSEAY